MHYRIDDDSRDRGDSRRYISDRDQYRDDDDGDNDDIGNDCDDHEIGQYDGITDMANSVQGCYGSDTDMEKKKKEMEKTRSIVTKADSLTHIHQHMHQHTHRQQLRGENQITSSHLRDSTSHLLDDERVPLLILAFAANLWEVCTIIWILYTIETRKVIVQYNSTYSSS